MLSFVFYIHDNLRFFLKCIPYFRTEGVYCNDIIKGNVHATIVIGKFRNLPESIPAKVAGYLSHLKVVRLFAKYGFCGK